MTKRGPKGSHLQLVDATSAAEDPAASNVCGGRTRSGGACKKSPGLGTEHPGVGQCRYHDGQVEPGSPCPLPLTDLESRLWDQVTGQLKALRLYRIAFWPHVYGLVIALAMLHTAYAELDTITVKGRGASMKKAPSVVVVHQMLAQVRQYSNDLGLNPSSLASIGPPADDPTKPRSRMAELIRGRGPR